MRIQIIQRFCSGFGPEYRRVPILLVGILAVGVAIAAPSTNVPEREAWLQDIRRRILPDKPPLVLTHDVTYTFASFRIFKIATATTRVIEGLWTNAVTGAMVPAYYIGIRVDSLEKPEMRSKSRLVLHDSVECVMTRPDIDTILYVRQADEIMNPLLGRRMVNRHVDIYDFQSGHLDYYNRNDSTGLVNTNMSGRENFDRQGREIAVLLKAVGQVYRGETPNLNRTNSPTVYVDYFGTVTPFFLHTTLAQRPAMLVSGRVPAIRTILKQQDDNNVFLSMWSTSFIDMARVLKDDPLLKRAIESPDWCMVPLVADYDLVLGCIRSSITGMRLESDDAGTPTSEESSVATQAVVEDTSWSFGVMADTQWTCKRDPAGNNANQVAKSIIDQINPQFINAKVKFVIQVGDLTENGNNADIQTRASAAQPLLDAGIGFFPIRGNHETVAGVSNGYGIPQFQASFPQTRGLTNTFGAANFNSPIAGSNDLDGMSYSFDYGSSNNGARFVLIDNWATPGSNVWFTSKCTYGYSIGDQQSWISTQLDMSRRGVAHAFVLSHQPLIAENHQDSPFGGYVATNPTMQNAFFASLQTNNVKYYICGHDHIHQRSLIASPDGFSCVEEVIGASASSKFYTPKPTHDTKWEGQKYRETPLSQELSTVGYSIYTVDGPRVTVDYYSDDHGRWQSDTNYPSDLTGKGDGTQISPLFHFVKNETFGYSLNGQRFLVGQGGTYATVADSVAPGEAFGETYKGTSARILFGANNSTSRDYDGRAFIREINTGWAPSAMASDIFLLWGMVDRGASQSETYVLSVTYHPMPTDLPVIRTGRFGLLSRASRSERWVAAVDLNVGGTPTFVLGPWESNYTLGTCGVDTNTASAWAVMNHAGDFAVGTAPKSLGALRR